ncbi:MAG: hypothetical protein AB7F89_15500 [Pirellulaceae bacterium]
MLTRLLACVVGLSLCGSSYCIQAAAAEPQPDVRTPATSAFLRLKKDEEQRPESLETAVVRYRRANRDTRAEEYVDLVGAVHIGERSYYDELNRLFRGYDAVLYELVAPEDANVPQPGRRSGHPVGLLQVAMKNLLGLEFQLDCVDYDRKNFVHADLSPEEFQKSMEARSESFTKMFFRLMGQGMAQQSKDPARTSDLTVFSAFFAKDRSNELKRAMALQMEDMEKATSVFDGPDGSTIITERNKRALTVLAEQQQAGKRKLAIFYGAAHLPDFDRKLRDMGYAPVETKWLAAWDFGSP